MTEQTERDPFYVGYLPLPKWIKRFIVPWLVGNIVLALGIAAVIAQQHREPGEGVWETSSIVELEGAFVEEPYPILQGYNKQTYILVGQGKIGAQDHVAFFRDATLGSVKARGYLIERDGRRILELISEPGKPGLMPNLAIDSAYSGEELSSAEHFFLNQEDLGAHTLRGEIVDPKCYLGVMQPGDGKTHKVCATLCIKGGIPPMLLVRDKQGTTAAYLLTDSAGKAFPESHHEYIADPIEITGQVLRDGDLLILRADLDSIQRLDASD